MATNFFGNVKTGATGVIVDVLMAKTVGGLPDTGIAYTSFSGWYIKVGDNAKNDFTFANLSTLATAFGATDSPPTILVKEIANGWYRMHIPNVVFSSAELSSIMIMNGTTSYYAERFQVGVRTVDVDTIKTQAVTAAAGVTFLASVGTATTNTAQTGDSFARIGATGSGLTSLATAASVAALPSAAAIANQVYTTWWADSASHLIDGTCPSNGTSTTIPFASSASSVDDYYNGVTVELSGGAGAGQWRPVTDYDGASQTATVYPAFKTSPGTTTTYRIHGESPSGPIATAAVAAAVGAYTTVGAADNTIAGQLRAEDGLFQPGSTTGSVTLATTAPSVDLSTPSQAYLITSGALAGKVFRFTSYDTSGKSGNIYPSLPTAPASGVGYRAIGLASVVLSPDGFDLIPITAPTTPATNFRQMVVQTWRRFFKKATKTATHIKTYADDGTTVVTDQGVTDDGTTETQGTAT